MEVETPNGGCFVASGFNTFDHYLNGQRTRYYLNYNKLLRGSSSSYNTIPSNYNCLSSGDLIYKPELAVYFQFFSFVIIFLAGFVLFNCFFKRLWSSR